MDGRTILLMAVVLFACGGCAAQKAGGLVHDTKTEQEFYRDLARCEALSNSAGSQQVAPSYPGQANNPMASFAQGWNMGSATNTASSRDRILGNCMKGEGWYSSENGASSPEGNKAVESRKVAVQENPGNSSAWFNLGDSYTRAGQYAKAVESYQQAIKIDPGFVAAWYNMGNANMLAGNRDKMMEAYERLKTLDPETATRFLSKVVM